MRQSAVCAPLRSGGCAFFLHRRIVESNPSRGELDRVDSTDCARGLIVRQEQAYVASLRFRSRHKIRSTPAEVGRRVGWHPGAMNYTASELMVAAAAREIRDGDVVFVGMRLPLIAFVVAKKTHAPGAVGVFENGILRDAPARELLYTMSDGPNITGALSCLSMLECMALLQRGRVSLGFLGAAEVDRHGNLNSTEVRKADGGLTRLPGSGGACDIAALSQRFVALLDHQKFRLPERVQYITSPGYGPWRQARLARGGPAAVITTRAVLRFSAQGVAYLDSHHPGTSIEEVLAHTGWALDVSPQVHETPPPSAAELRAIRAYDRKGFWTR